ncbi:MAG: HD domain-containing protein [Elusimicrobiota bacterium]
MNKTTPLEHFSGELKLISNDKLYSTVIKILNRAPEYFWVIPGSLTGKNHPEDENVKGGKVLHTRRTVYIAVKLAKVEEIDEHEKELLIAALLVHDLFCQGKNDKPKKHMDPKHPDYLVEQTTDLSNLPYYEDIMEIASGHLGKWGTEENYKIMKQNKLAKMAHIADYIASSKEVIIKI